MNKNYPAQIFPRHRWQGHGANVYGLSSAFGHVSLETIALERVVRLGRDIGLP